MFIVLSKDSDFQCLYGAERGAEWSGAEFAPNILERERSDFTTTLRPFLKRGAEFAPTFRSAERTPDKTGAVQTLRTVDYS